jgi:hypothetical protein
VTGYLDLAGYLLIAKAKAKAKAGMDAFVLANWARLELAESALATPQAGLDEVETFLRVAGCAGPAGLDAVARLG